MNDKDAAAPGTCIKGGWRRRINRQGLNNKVIIFGQTIVNRRPIVTAIRTSKHSAVIGSCVEDGWRLRVDCQGPNICVVWMVGISKTIADIIPTIKQLSQKGVQGIIGDKTVAAEARTLGLTSELIESGSISLKKAISEAIRVVRAQEAASRRDREKAEQIQCRVFEINSALESAVAAVEELSASSQELASISQGAANIAGLASQEVKNTADILDIIRRVANQINLLGLNAAIEAARAGDLGRGFSVVATEVRKLAEESNNSASNIGAMLNQFRNSVERVLQNVEQCNVITQEQAGATQEIAQKLDGLRMVSQKLLEMAEGKS